MTQSPSAPSSEWKARHLLLTTCSSPVPWVGVTAGRNRCADYLAAFHCDVDWKREIDGALPGLLDGTDTLERFAGKLSNAQYAALRDVLEK